MCGNDVLDIREKPDGEPGGGVRAPPPPPARRGLISGHDNCMAPFHRARALFTMGSFQYAWALFTLVPHSQKFVAPPLTHGPCDSTQSRLIPLSVIQGTTQLMI